MKHPCKPTLLTAICAAAGLLCLGARIWLFTTGIDEKGLLLSAHPGNALSIILVALTVAVSAILVFKEQTHYTLGRPVYGGLSLMLLAVGSICAAWKLLQSPTQILYLVTGMMGLIAAALLVVYALALFQNRHGSVLLYAPCILFFLLLLLCRYQQWSPESELQRYAFQLLAMVSFMLSLYHRMALAIQTGSSRRYLFFSRLALFFCIAAPAYGGHILFHGALALCILLDDCQIHEDQAL